MKPKDKNPEFIFPSTIPLPEDVIITPERWHYILVGEGTSGGHSRYSTYYPSQIDGKQKQTYFDDWDEFEIAFVIASVVLFARGDDVDNQGPLAEIRYGNWRKKRIRVVLSRLKEADPWLIFTAYPTN